MRQIKFRGKRLDNGEWMEGHLLHHNPTCSVDMGGKDMNIYYIVPLRFEIPALKSVSVLPETVGQFTGLFDKNGTEIYEGDILGRYTDSGEIVPLSIVVYVNNGFFAQSLVSGADFNFDLERILERQNAIGNIHDNLELLKTE